MFVGCNEGRFTPRASPVAAERRLKGVIPGDGEGKQYSAAKAEESAEGAMGVPFREERGEGVRWPLLPSWKEGGVWDCKDPREHFSNIEREIDCGVELGGVVSK